VHGIGKNSARALPSINVAIEPHHITVNEFRHLAAMGLL
jgi:hypothetical protein